MAALALLVQIVVPRGFMLSLSGGVNGPGFGAPTLVICTGHGPLLVDAHGKPAHAPGKSGSDAPCGFAGHGAGAEPPVALALAASPAQMAHAVVLKTFDLAPGLGLAAPPPPSQGPPEV